MRIEVFGKPMCELCEAAINLLDINFISYQYYNVEYLQPDELTDLILNRTESKTLPIIFIDGREVNTLDELREYFRNTNKPSTGTLGSSRIREEGQD